MESRPERIGKARKTTIRIDGGHAVETSLTPHQIARGITRGELGETRKARLERAKRELEKAINGK